MFIPLYKLSATSSSTFTDATPPTTTRSKTVRIFVRRGVFGQQARQKNKNSGRQLTTKRHPKLRPIPDAPVACIMERACSSMVGWLMGGYFSAKNNVTIQDAIRGRFCPLSTLELLLLPVAAPRGRPPPPAGPQSRCTRAL